MTGCGDTVGGDRWDLIQVVLILWTSVVLPYKLSFVTTTSSPKSAMFWIEAAVDLFFILDIIMNFRTSILISEGGEVMTDTKKIACNYLSGWFILDAASCLPLNYIVMMTESEGESGGGIKLAKTLRLFRISKMLRVLRLRRTVEKYAHLMYSHTSLMTVINVLRAIVPLLYGSHVLACIWHSIQDQSYVLTTLMEDAGKTANSTITPATVYVYAFWESITDLSVDLDRVHSDRERIFAAAQHVLYTIGVSFLTGTLASAIIAGSISDQKYRTKMSVIREFLEKKKVPRHLREKVTTFYCQLYYRSGCMIDENEVLAEFPPHLRRHMAQHMYADFIQNMPFFRGLDFEVVLKLCLAMRPLPVGQDEIVFREGDTGNEMYVVVHGTCHVHELVSQCGCIVGDSRR